MGMAYPRRCSGEASGDVGDREEKTCLGFGFGLVGGMIRDGVGAAVGWKRRRDGAGEFYNVRPRTRQLPPSLARARPGRVGSGRVGSTKHTPEIAKHWRDDDVCRRLKKR